MKVVKIDKVATDYYIKLTNLQSEYRRVGVNYNQVVKAVHSGELTEKKALALLTGRCITIRKKWRKGKRGHWHETA